MALRIVSEFDPLNNINEPIGVSFTTEEAFVWYGKEPVLMYTQTGIVTMAISHRGDLVAILSAEYLAVVNVETTTVVMHEELGVTPIDLMDFQIHFSADDSKMFMTSFPWQLDNEQDGEEGEGWVSLQDRDVQIFDIGKMGQSGNSATMVPEECIDSFRFDCDLTVSKFYFGLTGWLFTCGLIETDDNDENVSVQEFGILDLRDENKTASQRVLQDDIVYVQRFYESESDPDGYIVRLIASLVDEHTILVTCFKSNGGTLYEYNTDSKVTSVVASFFLETDVGTLMNGGISPDLKTIAVLVHNSELNNDVWMMFYSVDRMRTRRKAVLLLDDKEDYTGPWNHNTMSVRIATDDQLSSGDLVDAAILVDDVRNCATLYTTKGIETVFMGSFINDRVAMAKRARQKTACIAYSGHDNFIGDGLKKDRAVALFMGLHPRLGANSKMGGMDSELLRIIANSSVFGHF
jgi:hypothetical protein